MLSESSTINVIPICTIWRLFAYKYRLFAAGNNNYSTACPFCANAHMHSSTLWQYLSWFLKKRSSHFSAKRLALSASFSTKQWTDVNLIILLRPLFSAKQLVSRHKLPKCFVPGMQISSATRLPVSVCICVVFFFFEDLIIVFCCQLGPPRTYTQWLYLWLCSQLEHCTGLFSLELIFVLSSLKKISCLTKTLTTSTVRIK